jgi:ribosomal protein S18 acetylase RimI-like enzyme
MASSIKEAPMSKKKNSNLTIRELDPEEMPGIFPIIKLHNPKLSKRAFDNHLKAMLPLGYHAVVAFDDAKIVAVCGYWIRRRFWCGKQFDIDNFYIDPAYRGDGLGTTMMECMEQKAIDENCELIVLDVYADNTRGHRFYHRMGYVITGYHFTKIPGSATPYARKNRS